MRGDFPHLPQIPYIGSIIVEPKSPRKRLSSRGLLTESSRLMKLLDHSLTNSINKSIS